VDARIYWTFSFETETDRAVAISLVLTLLARTGIETAPLQPTTRRPPVLASP
jgi:hypothetical protein